MNKVDFLRLFVKSVRNHLPLKISSTSWDGSHFGLHGKGWNISIRTSFRFVFNESLLGCIDNEIDAQIEKSIGKSIENIELLTEGKSYDFSIILNDGVEIDIFCETYFEPWIFSIEGETTFIPSY